MSELDDWMWDSSHQSTTSVFTMLRSCGAIPRVAEFRVPGGRRWELARRVTRAVVGSCTALTSLDLVACREVTDVGVRALSSLPALTSLDLRYCRKVTAAGVQALRNTTAAPSLHIEL